MLREDALNSLNDKALAIETVETILAQFKGDGEVENAVAMNLSIRTSVHDRLKEKSDAMVRILGNLAYSKEMSVRWAVAKNPHTPCTLLEHLSQDNINLVRALVATNPTTPPSVLQTLFHDEKIVRDGLSGNPSTPRKLLEVLADDEDPMVRLRVVENPSISEAICTKLCHDSAPNVSHAAHVTLKRLHDA